MTGRWREREPATACVDNTPQTYSPPFSIKSADGSLKPMNLSTMQKNALNTYKRMLASLRPSALTANDNGAETSLRGQILNLSYQIPIKNHANRRRTIPPQHLIHLWRNHLSFDTHLFSFWKNHIHRFHRMLTF